MKLDHDFIEVSKLSEDPPKKKVLHQKWNTFFPQIQMKTKKKRSSLKMEHFFSPNSSEHLCSDTHQSQIIGGDADVNHTQTIGGDTVKLLGGYIPHITPGFGTPAIKYRSFVGFLLGPTQRKGVT